MKTNQFFIFGSIFVLAASQSLESLPECGKTCVNNMFAKARELGCPDGDTTCLCQNINFAYGIRDCSTALCGALSAAPVITYGSNYCNSVGSGNSTNVSGGDGSLPPPSPAIPGPAPTNSASATNTPDGNHTPVSTAPLVSTITTGNEPITTTLGFSTVYSSNEGSKPTDSSSTATTSSSSDSTQSSETEGQSSTSAGSGARQTACAGLAAAAGLAAMLL